MSTGFLGFQDDILAYLKQFYRDTDVQRRLREETASMRESNMQISPEQGALMQFLAIMVRAKVYLEVGVFTGYSSLSIGLVLPDNGKIIACDVSREWTDIGRKYWQEAGVAGKIDLRLKPAAETLRELIADGYARSFDMMFIDADKENYAEYYALGKKLISPSGLILIDNTLWSGKVADPSVHDAETTAIRELNLRIQMDPEVESFLLPIGDGLTLVVKKPA